MRPLVFRQRIIISFIYVYLYDESPDGDLIQVDMTQILLNQEKYRRLLGDMNVQNIISQMYPSQSTVMDGMTDEQRFDCVISRHCQTMSERQAVLQQLAEIGRAHV